MFHLSPAFEQGIYLNALQLNNKYLFLEKTILFFLGMSPYISLTNLAASRLFECQRMKE